MRELEAAVNRWRRRPDAHAAIGSHSIDRCECARAFRGAGSAAQTAAATPGAAQPLPNSPLPNVGAPDRGILADTPDPFKAITDAIEKQQAEQKAAQLAAQLAAQQAQPPPQAPAPAPLPPPPQVDYAGLIMPRIKRGLLADDYSSGLLGAA